MSVGGVGVGNGVAVGGGRVGATVGVGGGAGVQAATSRKAKNRQQCLTLITAR